MAFTKVRRVLGGRLVLASGVTLGLLCLAVAINAMGIRIVGDVDTWSRWLDDHRLPFVVWRLALYAFTGYGWWRMRTRIRTRDPSDDARVRLRRAEVAAVCIIVLLETSMLLQRA